MPWEVIEKATGAAMSHMSPDPKDTMGTTLWDDPKQACNWILDQGLELTHVPREVRTHGKA